MRYKVLPVKLPEDHPLHELPKGEKSKKARDYINLGMSLSLILEEIASLKEEISLFRQEIRLLKIDGNIANELKNNVLEMAVSDFLDLD